VCNLISQLGRKIDKLEFTADHIKHFILMNDKEKAEVAKMIKKNAIKKK